MTLGFGESAMPLLKVLAGRVPMAEPALSGEFGTLMGWADAVRTLGVRANADTSNDARVALKFGAEGIRLCRTEHMFFEEDCIRAVREMILTDDEQSRRAALAKLLPMQRADFVELFEIVQGLPVTIRLLDPPLHEFLPHSEEEIAEVAAAMGADPKKLADRARELHEFNPMLGFCGCRLAAACSSWPSSCWRCTRCRPASDNNPDATQIGMALVIALIFASRLLWSMIRLGRAR
jgi:pyruvate,orthophosphate dikinase